jgi:hypothetical protein
MSSRSSPLRPTTSSRKDECNTFQELAPIQQFELKDIWIRDPYVVIVRPNITNNNHVSTDTTCKYLLFGTTDKPPGGVNPVRISLITALFPILWTNQ